MFFGGLLTMSQGKGADGIGSTVHVVSVGPLTDGSPETCSWDELDEFFSCSLVYFVPLSVT